MKKVLIIHTGGTFGMIPADPERTLHPGNIEKDLDEYIPSIHQIADIKINIPFNLDSSNIGPDEWKMIYGIIRKNMDIYDGFVIIHGTDTLVYSASALSYLFLDLQKPVILTGAQRPLSALRTDARNNLINAVELATYNIPEVLICFGDKLFRGNRTKKNSIEKFDSFYSPNYPPLATIGLNVQIKKHYFVKERLKINLKPDFYSSILSVKIFPGLDAEAHIKLLDDSIQAVILEGLGAGNLPTLKTNWIRFIKTAHHRKKLIFITSQSPHGTVDLNLYACGRQAENEGARSLKDMTIEAALVKLMILLANFEDLSQVQEFMLKPIAGEIS